MVNASHSPHIEMKLKIEKDFKRPWGGFIKFIDNRPCTVKILQIKKGKALSLQLHKLREEFWYLISGKVRVTIGKNKKDLKGQILKKDDSVFIPKKSLHRAEGLTFSKILEISFGKFKEDDIIRYNDRYGRD